MAAENYDLTLDEFIAGDDDIRTDVGTLVTGQNVAARTPLKLDAAGKYTVLTAPTDAAVAIAVSAVDATAADKEILVYTGGSFFIDKLTGWPGAPTPINTDLLKKGVFAGTPIKLVAKKAGEVLTPSY